MCEIWSDDEWAQAWEDRIGKARKEYRCSGCRLPIHPGQTYLRAWAVRDGDNTVERACADCWFVREAFGQAHDVIVWPNALHNLLQECIDEDDDEGWRMALAALIRRKRKARCEAQA